MTWSPGLTAVTPGPGSTTTPAASWPGTNGSGMGQSPFMICQSLMHTPAALTWTRTSPAFGGSCSTSRICSGLLTSVSTAARMSYLPSSSDPEARYGPDEVAFAQFDAVGAQDGIGRRGVEIEVGQGEVHEIHLAFQRDRLAGDLDGHVALFRAVDLGRLQRLHEVDRPAQAGLQLRQRLFVVLVGRDFESGETRRSALGKVADQLNLAYERKHVREQARIEQHGGVDFLCRRVSFGLVQNACEGLKLLHEGRNGGL